MTGRSGIRAAAVGTPAPVAEPEPREAELHGEPHRDDYAYLRDSRDPRTRRYIEAENHYFAACMDTVAESRRRIYDELASRILENDVSVPEDIGAYRYYTRVEAGRQYPVHCRVPRGGGEEQVYLDENLLAGEGRYCDVSVLAICPGRERIAVSVDRAGNERYEILVGDIGGGSFYTCATDVGDSLAWSGAGTHLLYTGIDANARPDSVWLYDLAARTHRQLYAEPDPAFYVSVWLSRSEQWLFIDSASNCSSETRVLAAQRPLDEPVVLIPRREDVEYAADHHGDRFLILTNDVHENFRLAAMPADAPRGAALEELIPPDQHVTLEYIDVYQGHWVTGELRDGVEHVGVRDPVSGSCRYLPGSDALTHLEVEDLYDFGADFVRYEYSTPVVPHTTFDFDTGSGASTRRKAVRPPGFDEDAYICERLEVPVEDVRVPLTVIRHRDTGPGGVDTPLLLTGYGAYEESVDMQFDSDMVSLLDRGVVVAHAHVRGGGDLGPAWHDGGRLENKDNSFRDFLACAHFLVERGYTGPGRIAAWGASAGGLLVAVAAQREPRLFAAVVLEVPFLDVINTLLDPGLPLTEHDYDEFGNPAVAEEYHWLRSYSPYDNIDARAWPPMLVITALNDQRVGCWEALKWTARVRATRTDAAPLLLKVDDTGHLGETGRYDAVRESAIVYTFLLDMWQLLPGDQ